MRKPFGIALAKLDLNFLVNMSVVTKLNENEQDWDTDFCDEE